MRRTLPLWMALALPAAGQEAPLAPYPETPATPPEKAEATFRVLNGFSMELIAAEPLVTDPVAIAYDEIGRAYVAEMNDYPYTDKARHKASQENPTDQPIGRIRLLEDTDEDGRFDKASVFADGLSWPTGVACWKGGVFVTATPDFWYLKDEDGDGVADVRRKVYTGFRKLNVQAVVNNPVWGLDHRIYVSGSTNGGELVKTGDPGAPAIKMSRHDLSFDPVAETLELETGYGRFGNTFDDYGNRFICNIRTPALHVVIDRRHLESNPHVPPLSGIEDIGRFGEFMKVHPIAPPEAWRVERAERWAREEADRHPSTELVGAGAVTSSSGITAYRGDAYPPDYRGQIFVADVSSSLFFRLALKPAGVSFEASRVDEGADFAASTDVWSRPVNFVNAPDGCLHVLDMYREAIEHPWSIPEDIHARIDLERGRDKGRIYRLAQPGFARRPTPRLGQMESADLVPFLEHPNAWHRETAHRLLFERQDTSVNNLLGKMLRRSAADYGRMHAFWSLAGLGALREEDLEAALGDSSPAVREQALKLAGGGPAAVRALGDPHPRVRFRAVLEGGEAQAPEEIEALAKVCRENGEDPWFETAIVASSANRAGALVAALLAPGPPPASGSLLSALAHTVGARGDAAEVAECARALWGTAQVEAGALVSAAAGLADGLKAGRGNLFEMAAKGGALGSFRGDLLAAARAIATDGARPLALRARALTLFRSTPVEEAIDVYAALLRAETPPELQSTAIESLASFASPRVAPAVLEAWPRLSPQVRPQAIEALLARPERLDPLIGAIEAATISPHFVTQARRNFLMEHADAGIAARARNIFARARPREAVIADYLEAPAKFAGDVGAGRAVFQKACLACHRSGEEGFSELGPNLATVAQWDAGQLLVNILDPSREVSPGFIEYLVAMKDGSVVSGAVVNETEAAVLLRLADGTRRAVYRRDIESMRNTGLSLMPEGLEAVITAEEMAHLIAYLKRR